MRCADSVQIFVCDSEKHRQYLTYGGFFDRKQTGEDAPEMRCRINQRFHKREAARKPIIGALCSAERF